MAVLRLHPNANGDLVEFLVSDTDHYTSVDEEIPNGDTDYVYYWGEYKIELFQLQNHTSQTGVITHITLRVNAKAHDMDWWSLRRRIRTYGADYFDDSKVYLSPDYSEKTYTWYVNPHTGQPWTWPEIDALQAGISIPSSDGGCRLTWVAVDVYYTLVVPTVTTQDATGIAWDNGTFHATFNGTITDTGGKNCDERGFQWGYSSGSYPYVTQEFGSFGTGIFDSYRNNMTGDTVYFRARAHNDAGWGYGSEKSFSPPAVPPDPPTNVQATDGTHTDKVVITWTKSDGATGYQVYRDGTPLGWLGDVATFDDTGAGAPYITPGNAVASDGDYSGYVFLNLSGTSRNNGTTHTYKVKARSAAGESGYSGTNTGYRGYGTLYYQWYRSAGDSDASYSSINGATSSTYSDTGAPAPTITKGTVTASDGTYHDKVRLDASGYGTNNGAGRYYKCYLIAAGCSPVYSGANRGYRGPGTLNRQWQKSAGDSDASYSDISGATSDPYDYYNAPAPFIIPGDADATDGEHETYVFVYVSGHSANIGAGRYYRAKYTASGCVTQYTTGNRGYRGVGSLNYQWYKSAADSDANYSEIDGATSSIYSDYGAPANGDGRYYKVYLTALGAFAQYSSPDRGYRAIAEWTSMIGGPTGWAWGIVNAGDSIIPVTTDGGKTWTWGLATGAKTFPSGGPTAWIWQGFDFGEPA